MNRYSADTVWTFRTARFLVTLELTHCDGYIYDGDDEDGETQAALDNGDLIAFDSAVRVFLDGEEIGADYLGGSVYSADNFREFYKAHRDRNPLERNCTIGSELRGGSVICHYFPGMVSEAVKAARAELKRRAETAPRMRAA